MAFIVGHILAIAVGVSLGLIGGGGSILAVPILIYVIGVGTKEAIAISLISIGIVSAIGALSYGLEKRIRVDVAFMFAPAAMVGAYIGAYSASFPWVSDTFQLVCFTISMALASILMIAKSHKNQLKSDNTSSHLKSNDSDRKIESYVWKKFLIPVEGLGIGILTGFVGIGGGFAIVPALVLLAQIPIKQAVGTSLFIIFLKSITGFLGYVGQVNMDWLLIGTFTGAASIGTISGCYLAKFIQARVLQASFGYFILFFAILIVVAQLSPQ